MSLRLEYERFEVESLISSLEVIKAQLEREIIFKLFNEIFPQALSMMQSAAPIRTGFLRNNISIGALTPTEASISSKAGYSGFVNYGTAHMEARPFFSQGAEYIRNTLPKRWLQEVSAVVSLQSAAFESATKVIQ